LLSGASVTDKVVTYTAPKGALLNDDFVVKVKSPNGSWQGVPSHLVKVDEVRNTKHHVEHASMAFFDFSGEVEISVTYTKGNIDKARIRPLSYGITPKIDGNTLTFILKEASNLSIEVNDDIFHNLHLFANPLMTDIPDKNRTDVIYFGPGIHEFEGKKLNVPSNTTVYVDGGAILRGQLLIENVNNVKVIGRGMVEHTVKMGIHIARSENVLVDGLFVTQCATGGSKNVTIRNV